MRFWIDSQSDGKRIDIVMITSRMPENGTGARISAWIPHRSNLSRRRLDVHSDLRCRKPIDLGHGERTNDPIHLRWGRELGEESQA